MKKMMYIIGLLFILSVYSFAVCSLDTCKNVTDEGLASIKEYVGSSDRTYGPWGNYNSYSNLSYYDSVLWTFSWTSETGSGFVFKPSWFEAEVFTSFSSSESHDFTVLPRYTALYRTRTSYYFEHFNVIQVKEYRCRDHNYTMELPTGNYGYADNKILGTELNTSSFPFE